MTAARTDPGTALDDVKPAAGLVPAGEPGTPAYRRYALGILTVVFTMSFVDRGLINLLVEPIARDLGLSDTQVGFLTGIAFALFYATLGVPAARWADRGNRVTITSLAIALWGLTVMACLLVTTFAQLLFARIAAAVGESGCMPPTYSLLGDYFPEPSERTRAMTFYWLAGPLSGLFGFGLGGWLNELYGWRATFFIVGVPALLVAIVVKLTIREPRLAATRAIDCAVPAPRMREVIRLLWQRRAARHLSIAIVLLFTVGMGMNPWYAAFLIRVHGLGTAELGLWLGLIFGVGGIAGVLLGGYVAGRWFGNNERGQMRLTAVVVAVLVPCYVAFLLLPGGKQALLALAVLIVVFQFFLGPTFALMQRLVEDGMRATTMAVVMLLANLIGMGIGPQVVGILSDLLMPAFGRHSLRYAMLAMSVVALWAAYHFWCVGRTVTNDLGTRTMPLQSSLRPTVRAALADTTES